MKSIYETQIRPRSNVDVQTRTQYTRTGHWHSDSFTILGLWVLGLAVSNINESQVQTYESKTLFLIESLQYYCIPGLAGTRWNKNLCAKDAGCAGNKITADIHVNVYIGNKLTRLSFQSWHLLKIKLSYLNYFSTYRWFFFKKKWFSLIY